jgi:hypothetical protein
MGPLYDHVEGDIQIRRPRMSYKQNREHKKNMPHMMVDCTLARIVHQITSCACDNINKTIHRIQAL